MQMKQYTIQVTVGLKDKPTETKMREVVQAAARHVYANAILIHSYEEEGDLVMPSVAVFSDDFFNGHSQLPLNGDKVKRIIEEAPSEEELLLRQQSFLQTPVDDLELSVRSVNCLRNADCYGFPAINTVADLVKFSANDLLRLPNLGKRTLCEISELLDDYGLKLSTTDIPRLP